MNKYEVKGRVLGHYTVEDPRCPSNWRGSGCYDVNVKTWLDFDMEVYAESEESATALVYGVDWTEGTTIEVDDVLIKKMTFISDCDEDAGADVPCSLDWEEAEPSGPDPDDMREERMLRGL